MTLPNMGVSVMNTKLLVQSDDYGISPAVSAGIIYGITHGIIRNTGAFVNMPWSSECLKWIFPYLDKVALGLDLNLTTGYPLSSPEEISSLTWPDGSFYSSWESRKLDKATPSGEHTDSQEVSRELEAQLEHFIQLVGHKPAYIHPHAYTTPRILEQEKDLAKRAGVPFSVDCFEKIFGRNLSDMLMPWYKKPPTPENQLDSSLKEYLLTQSNAILNQEYSLVVGHMGYVDKELMELSSYSLYRLNDLNAVTSPEILTWVDKNSIELITYHDLPL